MSECLKVADGIVVTNFECPYCGEPDAAEGIFAGEWKCGECQKDYQVAREDHY